MIVSRIASLDQAPDRELAFQQLLVLAGLRKLEADVEREAKQVPITENILDHGVIGREFKRGLAEGLERGRDEGGAQGERKILTAQLEKRFGPLPAWAKANLAARPEPELSDLAVRLLDIPSLEDLLR